jgi:hypothetical protein
MRAGIKAGKSRDQIVSSKDVLPGFDDRGPPRRARSRGHTIELPP